MTLCIGGIVSDKVIICADLRVSYTNGLISDHLVKVMPLAPNALLAFSGDIFTIRKCILPVIGLGETPPINFQRLMQIIRTIRREYASSSKKMPMQIIVACRGANQNIVVRTAFPSGKIHAVRRHGDALAIGDLDSSGRSEMEKVFQEIANWPAAARDLIMPKMMERTFAMITGKLFDSSKGTTVSDVMLQFVLTAQGIQFTSLEGQVYRGNLAQRNDGLGYTPHLSIGLNDQTGAITIRNHVTSETRETLSIVNYEPKKFGVFSIAARLGNLS